MALIFIMMISTNTITSLKSASEAYPEKYQTSKMERFVQTVNGVKLLIIFAKRSILDVWQGCYLLNRSTMFDKSIDQVMIFKTRIRINIIVTLFPHHNSVINSW